MTMTLTQAVREAVAHGFRTGEVAYIVAEGGLYWWSHEVAGSIVKLGPGATAELLWQQDFRDLRSPATAGELAAWAAQFEREIREEMAAGAYYASLGRRPAP